VKNNGYKWDGDTRDERESEFSDTSFSTTRGNAFHSTWAQERVPRKREQRMGGIAWAILIALGVSVLALYGVVSRLRG
jgi:hypothetical protein